MIKKGFVYIMANNRPTLYTGVTNNLIRRVYEHKNNLVLGFTTKYLCHKLVYFETCDSISLAIIREKQIKYLNREEKLKLIRIINSTMEDLYYTILGGARMTIETNRILKENDRNNKKRPEDDKKKTRMTLEVDDDTI